MKIMKKLLVTLMIFILLYTTIGIADDSSKDPIYNSVQHKLTGTVVSVQNHGNNRVTVTLNTAISGIVTRTFVGVSTEELNALETARDTGQFVTLTYTTNIGDMSLVLNHVHIHSTPPTQ